MSADTCTLTPDLTLAKVVTGSLPKSEWTHEAHVAVCTALVRRAGEDRALRLLSRIIPRLNRVHGTPNTDTSGYHATITEYYVRAVGALVAAGLDRRAIASHPSTGREAPLRHWHRETLFSAPARRHWIAPDISPLPSAFVAAA